MAWVGNCPLNEGKRSNRTQRSCAAVGTGQRRVGPAGSAPALSRSALRWQRENYVYIADGVHAPAHTWQRAARALPGAPARAPGEPLDLARTTLREKFAIERSIPGTPPSDIRWFAIDLNHAPQLPFEDGFFSVITLLAVVEHLDPTGLTSLFQEAHRVLRPGGRVIITTPAAWSDKLLRWMARVQLVSAEEIEEHAYAYTLPLLGWYFGRAGFAMDKVRFGYFEFRLNMWATAER